MVGFITTRSLLAHPSLIVREFGMHCFARCLWRTLTWGRNVTFLECIPFSQSSFPQSSESAADGSAMGIHDEHSALPSWWDAFRGVRAHWVATSEPALALVMHEVDRLPWQPETKNGSRPFPRAQCH